MTSTRKISRIGAQLGGAALFLSAGAALADTVTVTNYTYGFSDTIAANVGDNPTIATQIDVSTTSAGVLQTYCTDNFDYINPNTQYTYTREAFAAGETYVTGHNDTMGGTWTQSQVNLIQALLFNGSVAANNINTAAIQIAIWEVEYGTETNNAYNVLSNFGSGAVGTSDSTLAAAQTYLNDATSGIWSSNIGNYVVEYLTNPNPDTQPLLYLADGAQGNLPQGNPPAAPEPATLGLMGMGLVGLAYARRRKMI